MKRLILVSTLVLALLSSPIPASAQSTPGASPAGAPTATATDTVVVPIWPTTAVALPDMRPVASSFALGRIEGVSPDLLAGVTAKGYARKVTVDNQTIGQVLVVSVAKGDRVETISTEGLTAQFDAKATSQLFPEKTLDVSGSKAALVAALERLGKAKPAVEAKKPVADDVKQNQTSSDAPSNDLAAGYRSPSAVPTPAAVEDKAPVTEIRITTEGCPVRIDLAQGKAIRQSKEQTFTDGVLAGEGQCTDSEVGFVLKKSYPACPTDIVDQQAMIAWPQFSLYYTDDAGENHTVGECAKDEDTTYTITENEAQCPIFLDFSANLAVPQAALVYTNRNNAAVQARGCADSTLSAPIPMAENVANCPFRHDYGTGLSYELSMWTYVRGGITYQAAPCADTGRTFAHEKVYSDAAGGYICTPITNLSTKTVTLQSRKRITVDGVGQYITDCTPDTASQAILATIDGCMDPSKWTHDLDAGISYGQERFYYTKANGSREYVTACQISAVTYAHDEVITGYQPHDDQLWAYPLSTVTIMVAGSPYTVASSTVLPGAAQLPYTLNGTADVATGTVSAYQECMAYWETARSEIWVRPDTTEYAKAIGAGAPQGPTDVCVATTQTRQITTQNSWNIGEPGGYQHVCNFNTSGTMTFYSFQSRVKKVNAANGYTALPSWTETGSSQSGSFPSCGLYSLTSSSKTCAATSGGSQGELCVAGSY